MKQPSAAGARKPGAKAADGKGASPAKGSAPRTKKAGKPDNKDNKGSKNKRGSAPLPLAGFLLRAFAISWLVWLPLLPSFRVAFGPLATPYLHLMGSLGPAIAAVAVIAQVGGREGLQELLARILRVNVHIVWHFVAWFAAFGLFFFAFLISTLGIGDFVSFAGNTGRAEYPGLAEPVYWLAILVCYGFGEEIGWRGFLQPALERFMAPLTAALVTGVVWASWHLPLFWIAPGLAGLDAAGIAGWFVGLLLVSVLIAWVTRNARDSILIAAGFHATLDIAILTASPASVSPVVSTLFAIWGAVVAVLWARQDFPAFFEWRKG